MYVPQAGAILILHRQSNHKKNMSTMKKLLLSAALLIGSSVCHLGAQEKTTAAGVPLVKLNNGVEMPRFGLGTFLQGSNETC